jgi:hypothetical protein
MSQSLEGTWSGTLTVQNQAVKIIVHFVRSAGGIQEGTIDIPKQLAYGMKLTNLSISGNSVHFELPTASDAVFEGTAENAASQSGATIKGTFTQGDARGTFELSRGQGSPALGAATGNPGTPPAPEPAVADSGAGSAVRLPMPGGPDGVFLSGSLLVPEGAKSVVLILAGSGPTDRNGNSPLLEGRNDCLLMIARGLAESGIASLRVDKRGIAASAWPGFREEDISFDTFVSDAVSWIRYLKGDGRFSHLFVLGHSEGGLVATLAAEKERVDGEIVVATLGETYQKTLLGQLSGLPQPLLEQAERIVGALEAGNHVTQVPAELAPIFRPSVQPFLISAFRYDPAKELSKVDAPVLIVQGDRDLQVSVDQAERLYRTRMAAGDGEPQRDTSLIVVHGMNHVMKEVPEGREANIAAYGDPSLPVARGLMMPLERFLRDNS